MLYLNKCLFFYFLSFFLCLELLQECFIGISISRACLQLQIFLIADQLQIFQTADQQMQYAISL